MKLVIVSGTYIQGPKEARVSPRSRLLPDAARRNYWHTTSCDKASECLFFVEGTGKFNLELMDTGKAPAAK